MVSALINDVLLHPLGMYVLALAAGTQAAVPVEREVQSLRTVQVYGVDRSSARRPIGAIDFSASGGDGSYSYVQPNQKEWGAKGWRTKAKSFEEGASFYRETLEGMMAKPYMIGWHHCGCLEQWDAAERGDSPMNENGFMDPFENYHTEWTDVIRDVNAKAARLHETAVG